MWNIRNRIDDSLTVFSLQRRFLVLLLVPVTLILLLAGVGSFMYARYYLLNEWESAARLRLEKTAHVIRMRLDGKRRLIKLIAEAEDVPNSILTQAYLAQKLLQQPGVRFVEIEKLGGNGKGKGPGSKAGKGRTLIRFSEDASGHMRMHRRHMMGMGGGMMMGGPSQGQRMPMGRMMEPSPVDVSLDETGNFLSIVTSFGGTEKNRAKRIEVRVAFDSFIKGVLEVGEWKHSYACLVTSSGKYLAHTAPTMYGIEKLGGGGDPLEKKVLAEMKTKHFGTVFGEGHPPNRIMGFYKVPTTNWFLILSSPGSAVLGPIVNFRFHYILAGIFSLVVIGLIIRWSTKPVATSIGEISEAAARVENGDYEVSLREDRSDEIGQLKRRFNKMIRGLKQRDLIERTFGRYVDKSIAKELMSRPEALRMGGEKHVVTILMADLRGFTKVAEKLQPEEVIRMVNRYFGAMIDVIDRHRGIIVDFFGDSILVFFNGMDGDVASRAVDAVNCAVEMQQELAQVSQRNQAEGLPRLSMGIGVHTGEVVIGNIGSEARAKYGIVGSPVNETNRIQSVAEGGVIMISEQTREQLDGRIALGPKCRACLKGLEGDRDLYRVLGVDGQQSIDGEIAHPEH
jgi:adenylate cyclase